MGDSWKVAFMICWAATFVALVSDEVSEQVAPGGAAFTASLIVFGISMAVAFIAGCLTLAAFLSARKKSLS